MSEELTTTEVGTLQECETVIQQGLSSFVEVGKSLMKIRDARLYRNTHDTFEAYCEEKWSLAKSQVYRLIDSAQVVRILSPIGELPRNEAQARPLTLLDTPKEQVAAWKEAVKTAPKDNLGQPVITARHVETVVRERIAERAPIAEQKTQPPLNPAPPFKFEPAAERPVATQSPPRPIPKSTGPTQWDRWKELNEKARSFFDGLVAERRENDRSNEVLNLYEKLDKAVASYRKSISRFGGT